MLTPGLSELEISPATAGLKISAILNEFKERYQSLLKDNQKALYRKICNGDPPIEVADLIPDFNHDNKEHIGSLRALRGIGLIVPEKGGSWEKDSKVIITKFGRAVNEFLNKTF